MGDSILTRGQRILLRILVWGGAALIADAIFLLLFRVTESTQRFRLPPDTLPGFYQLLVLIHTALGVVLAPLAIVFACWHLGRAWARRHNVAIATGITLIVSMLGLTYTGFFIVYASNSRDNRGEYWTHIALAGVMPLVYVVHRVTSVWAPAWRRVLGAFGGMTATALACIGVHVLTIPGPGHRAIEIETGTVIETVKKDDTLRDPAKDPFVPFAGGFQEVPKSSRFFPSAATTATGGWMESAVVTRDELPIPEELRREVKEHGFVKDTLIGAVTCKRCHPDIVEQWSRSAHRFSSMNNPFYRKPFTDMRARVAADGLDFKTRSQWCSGCHEPALMLAGEVGKDFDQDGANAQAGLTCLSCHAIDSLHNRTGNGAYNIPDDTETPYLFDDTSEGLLREIGDVIIKAKPNVHKQRMLKPFFRTSEFCSVCHKVSLDVPVNDYRWFRGQNEYDNWHDSGVAQNAARTFYRPRDPVTGEPVKKLCQDCHMPPEEAPLGDVSAKDGKVKSHRFLAVNSALPALRGDEDTIRRIEAFLQDKKMRVDVFALRRLNDDGSEKEWIPALDLTQPKLVPGETVEVHVVVRNLGVGHTFPGGTNDSNEGWLELRIDQPGQLGHAGQPGRGAILHSGWIGDDRHLDPSAHRYGAVIVAHDGSEAALRNPHDFHVMHYANVIGPSTSDVVRYRFVVPEDAAGQQLEIAANLNWRKFKQHYVDYVFEGKPAPEMPVTRIAGTKVSLAVAKIGEPVKPTPAPVYGSPDQWTRANDYGIGQLLKEDTRLAHMAFEEVQRVAPAKVDGYRNMARTFLRDGNIPRALELLAKCEQIAPGDRQTAWVWGVALQEDGRYKESEAAFRAVLEEFPEDRDTWRRLGRTLYLAERFEDSLAAYAEVLEIDPEDQQAHYHRMLNFQALGRATDAAEAAKAYAKYQIDESATAVTNEFSLKNPHANLETNLVHAHGLSKPDERRGAAGPGDAATPPRSAATAPSRSK